MVDSQHYLSTFPQAGEWRQLRVKEGGGRRNKEGESGFFWEGEGSMNVLSICVHQDHMDELEK